MKRYVDFGIFSVIFTVAFVIIPFSVLPLIGFVLHLLGWRSAIKQTPFYIECVCKGMFGMLVLTLVVFILLVLFLGSGKLINKLRGN